MAPTLRGYHTKRTLVTAEVWTSTLKEMDVVSRKLAQLKTPDAEAALNVLAKQRDTFVDEVLKIAPQYNAIPISGEKFGFELGSILKTKTFREGVSKSEAQGKTIDGAYQAVKAELEKAQGLLPKADKSPVIRPNGAGSQAIPPVNKAPASIPQAPAPGSPIPANNANPVVVNSPSRLREKWNNLKSIFQRSA
ncbi:hypothetical protein FRB99_001842 [Tulasnella sp. 403]|nr:hypothetical protein FRB99_001842 [Tulasnella sp. 403]